MEQIAEAAEVSPSTFFRYFPTKEDVAMYDALDPLVIAAFEEQPSGISPLEALRRAVRAVFDALPEEEMAVMRERVTLISEVPELRARMLSGLTATIQILSGLLAGRAGRSADDFAVRTLAGALTGTAIAAMLAAMEDPNADVIALRDQSMMYLEAGFPL